MLSCLMLSPDCANAARETATRHIAINLPIIFFMNPPSFPPNLRRRTAAQRWDAFVATKLQGQGEADHISRHTRSRRRDASDEANWRCTETEIHPELRGSFRRWLFSGSFSARPRQLIYE